MLLLLNALVYVHFLTFLVYVGTLLVQWDRPEKRTSRLMLVCGIILTITGIGLVAFRYPVINYYKIVPKTALLVIISVITARHHDRPLSLTTWRSLLGMAVLAALIAAWRLA